MEIQLEKDVTPIGVQHPCAVRSLRLSSDNQVLATADVDRVVCLWNKIGGEWIQRFHLALREDNDRFRALDLIRDVQFSTSGKQLIVAAGEALRVFNTDTGEQVWRNNADHNFSFLITTPLTIAVHDDSIACAYADGTIEVYEPGASRPSLRWRDNFGPVRLHFSPDGKSLIGTDRYGVHIWDSSSGVMTTKISAPGKVFDIAVSPTSDTVAVRTLEELHTYSTDRNIWSGGHYARAGLPVVEFSRDGELFVSLDAGGVSLYNADCQLIRRTVISERGPLLAAAFDIDGLLVACSSGEVVKVDL